MSALKKLLTRVLFVALFCGAASTVTAEEAGGIPGYTDIPAEEAPLGEALFTATASVPMPVAGGYDYYATYRFASLPGNNWVSGMRIVAQQNDTAYYLDTNNDGTAEYTGTLDAGGMYEVDVPTGVHLNTDKPVTVVQYDDSYADWEDVYLASTNEWGTDYWYAGIRGYQRSYDHLLFTAMTDGTVVNVDLNNDGMAEQTFTINRGQVAKYSAYAGYHDSSVGKDTRAGAHITSNYPIQAHVFSSMAALFGSAYTLLPTEALGTDYHSPFIKWQRGGSSNWDDSDRILVVASQDATTVSIDENNDGVPEQTALLHQGQTFEYPSYNKPTPFPMGTHISADKPIGAVYCSPRSMQQWDGGAVQLLPESAALNEYWNTVSWNTIKRIRPPRHLGNWTWPGKPQVILLAYHDGTTVNIDSNNDGTPETAYSLNKGEHAIHTVSKAGEHIYSDKTFFAAQTWYAEAAAEIEMLGYKTLIPVGIDIKPWSDPNSINLNNKGVIPVAILTTDDFDAAAVNPETVRFGPNEASPERYALEDIDYDGDIDMILNFRTQDTGIAPGDTEAVLTGETYAGRKIKGSDSVRVLESKGNN